VQRRLDTALVAPRQPLDRLSAVALRALYIAVQGHWSPV
jgi:hypothetical protein